MSDSAQSIRPRAGWLGGFGGWPVRLLALMLVALMQGPAMLTQEIAWAGMLVRYTQERGLKRGVVETFDGEHPCELCARAAKLRESERREPPTQSPSPKTRFTLTWSEMLALARVKLPPVPQHELLAPAALFEARSAGRGSEAPVPPPPEWV